MGTDLARIHADPRELAQITPIDEFRILDKYAGGYAPDTTRQTWLATISAGYLDTSREPPIPRASRKTDAEWIHMTKDDQERAPGLWQLLQVSGSRWLDAAVPFDEPALFLQQHFERRSASRLEVFGDANQLTEILVRKEGRNGKEVDVLDRRNVWLAGSDEYARIVETCSVSASFFFVPARWDGSDPHLFFPDGLGLYRLRFTSRHSLRELLASLRQIALLTRGRLMGIPMRLGIDWREVADPAGFRRTIPVWNLRFKPPEGLELTPATWLDVKRKALAEGELLHALPAPTHESVEDAYATVDADLDEPDGRALEALEAGPPCDAAFYQRAFFARVKDSCLDSDEARAGFVEGISGGRTSSLSEFLSTATEEQAAAMLAAAGQIVGAADMERNARRYEEIFGDEDCKPMPPSEPSPHTRRHARLQELLAEAKKRKLQGEPPLADGAEQDPLEAAISYWERRIENHDRDQQAARESGQPVQKEAF